MRRFRLTPSPALVVAIAALIVALCGVAVAGVTVNQSAGTPNTIHGCVKKGKLRIGATCRKGEKGLDFLAGSAANSLVGPQGAQGAKGDQGPAGSKGTTGDTGQAGSPDTDAQVLSKLTSVDGEGSGLDADTLDGIGSDGFTQGMGAFEGSATGMTAGSSVASQEIAGVGKLTLTCGSPAQAKSHYVNESGGNQRVFIDEGAGANASQVLAGGNSTLDSATGLNMDDARHTTYFVRLSSGFLLYDIWMTNFAPGAGGICHYFTARHVIGPTN